MGLNMKPGSRNWKVFMAKLYGWGAAIVIMGALFKIQHYAGASIMLIIGLSTEAVIFFFSAFEPIHEDTDWTLVYPELAGTADDEHLVLDESGDEATITEQLDNMLEEAKIGPELIDSLGVGLKGLSEQTAKLNNLSDASVATNEFVANMKGASQSANELSESYSKTAQEISNSASQLSNSYSQTAEELSSAASQLTQTYASTAEQLRQELNITSEDGGNYRDQLQKFTDNLSALNSAYEIQLKGTNKHMEATDQLYSGINELMGDLNDSITDTKKYKENMAELSRNLSSLNTVYGNMLTAMSGVQSQQQREPQNVGSDA